MAKKGIEVLRELFKVAPHLPTFGRCMAGAKLVSGGDGRCVCELDVTETIQNPHGSLHGGMTATLVDIVSSYALMTIGSGHPGVSVDLNVSYLRPALGGETIVIDAQVDRIGKTLAFTSVDIKRKLDGALIAKARHTKAFPAAAQKKPASKD